MKSIDNQHYSTVNNLLNSNVQSKTINQSLATQLFHPIYSHDFYMESIENINKSLVKKSESTTQSTVQTKDDIKLISNVDHKLSSWFEDESNSIQQLPLSEKVDSTLNSEIAKRIATGNLNNFAHSVLIESQQRNNQSLFNNNLNNIQWNHSNQMVVLFPPTAQTNEEFSNQLLINDDQELNDTTVYYPNPEEMLEPWMQNIYFFPIIITYIVSFIVGVTGNMLVFWLMLANKDNRNVTVLFLVSLSVSDLLLLIIYGPLEIINYFVLKWDKEGTICRLSAFAESVSAFGSILNLVAVTLERFVVIVFPIQSRALCGMHTCKRVLAGVWILSIFLALPMVFIKTTTKTSYTNYNITVNVYYCKELNDITTLSVYVYRFLTMFIIPSMIMIACYTWVIKELWLSTKNLHIQTSPTRGTSSSFEMNTLPSNQKQSRSYSLARNLNNNVINFKNKLTNNIVKHCRLNRRNNQETSFVECSDDCQTNGTIKQKINHWSRLSNRESISEQELKVVCDQTNRKRDQKDCFQASDCSTLDHNLNYAIDYNKSENINCESFEGGFQEINFNDFTINDCNRNDIMINDSINQLSSVTNHESDKNNKIINDFLLYTEKLRPDTDSSVIASKTEFNKFSSFDRANTISSVDIAHKNCESGIGLSDSIDTQDISQIFIETKPNKDKNYYDCSDKLLDASMLVSSTAASTGNPSIACILDNEKRQSTVSNQLANRITNNNQQKFVLRKHIRKEVMDVKSARKQVIKMLILIVILFLICWGPRLLMEILIKCCLNHFNHVTYALRIVFYLLPFIHSCLNPIVYTFMSTKFRTQLINIYLRIRDKRLNKKKHHQLQRQCSSRQTTIQSDNCTTKIVTVDTLVS